MKNGKTNNSQISGTTDETFNENTFNNKLAHRKKI